MFIISFFAFCLILTREVTPQYAEIEGKDIPDIPELDQIPNGEFTPTSSGNADGHGIQYAFDNSNSSYWESNSTYNDTNHPYIEISFDNIKDLDYLIYSPNTKNDQETLYISASIGNSSYQLKYIVTRMTGESPFQINFSRILWCDKLLIEFHSPNDGTPTCKQLYFYRVNEPKYKQIGIEEEDFLTDDQITFDDCKSVTSSGDLPFLTGSTMGHDGIKDIFLNATETHWVAKYPNNATFKNCITFKFKQLECITNLLFAGGYSTNRKTSPETRVYHGFPYVINLYAYDIRDKEYKLEYVCAGFPPTVAPSNNGVFKDSTVFNFPGGIWTKSIIIEFEEVSYSEIYNETSIFKHDYTPAARMISVYKRIADSPSLVYEPTEIDDNTTLSIEKTTFENLHSPSTGGAVYVANCTLTLTNTNFTNCSSQIAGGGIYLKINKAENIDSDSTTFNGLTFTDCESGYGGAICVIAKREKDITSVVGCTFNNNIALNSTLGGSALFLYTTKAKVQRCTFTGSSGRSTIIRYATSDPSEDSTTATILSTDFEFEVRDCIFEDQHQDSTFYINIDESIQQSPHILLTNNQLSNSAQLSKTTFKDQHHNEATTQTSNNNNRTNNRNIFLMILIPSLVVISLLFLLIIYRHHNDNQENSQETNNNA